MNRKYICPLCIITCLLVFHIGGCSRGGNLVAEKLEQGTVYKFTLKKTYAEKSKLPQEFEATVAIDHGNSTTSNLVINRGGDMFTIPRSGIEEIAIP